ncbi:hypothetical protein COU96_01860 [Candidatus Shapirobacteria bacterium CG10_big_fil_rev_8_21_14_0_10_38_14]|uniref:Resolvase HTH domain-containing protein n=1 Tax=Candidatus Shapirobacteria bacterium CG10_big_fil_rev_8_21_14_0_10_38_14 TaxID=1974483 RepID=A0A2M8L5H6_9BACT|nr:MAG: hypothetical protein COU96_01860 [Candidatus Shapirobacteria bacterium CG10_big_fil_rev_8_21_14_0_10_38_14]
MAKTKEKAKAIKLRKRGYSYSEILQEVKVAKSTLSGWFKSVQLAKSQKQRLTKKRREAQLKGAQSQKLKRKKITRQLINKGIKEIKTLTRKELFVIGVALYWAEGSKQKENNISQAVAFSNSDPVMIKLFLTWLVDICRIEKSDVKFELYIHESINQSKIKQIEKMWRNLLNLPKSKKIKIRLKRNIRKKPIKKNKNYIGLIKIKIAKSTNLNRKITGWIKGIARNYNGE